MQTVDSFGLNAFWITSIGSFFCEAVMDINGSPKPRESNNTVEQVDNILRSSDESFRTLLAALDLGWQVQQPVYLRPRWDEASEKVYHFILSNSLTGAPTMITTRYSEDVERLVMEEGWQVN